MKDPIFYEPGSNILLPELIQYSDNNTASFRVESVISGGMGSCIHLCTQVTNSHFALKTIKKDLLGNENTFKNFLKELEVCLIASECSAVVEAITIVEINGLPAVLTPWMTGGDLSVLLPFLNADAKINILLRVIRGLSWVYSNYGVIHCDLKPANILLDSQCLAYIADWGLARSTQALIKSAYLNTNNKLLHLDQKQNKDFSGTIIYAAPEQIRLDPMIDLRADIYSIGCIMYEMETGNPPFTGSNILEVAHKHLYEKPKSLGGLFHKSSMGLENIIKKCLEKDPSKRFDSYAELDKAISDVARDRGFSTCNCNVSKRLERFQLGKGATVLSEIVENALVKGRNGVILDFDKIIPFLEEVANLISLNRYKEAEEILSRFDIIDTTDSETDWHFGHSIAEKHALCLQQIPGRQNEATSIYSLLNKARNKPAEFYVNYSLLLLKLQNWSLTLAVCHEGLQKYPNDIDIIGNRTIAYCNIGDLNNAHASSLQRLSLRKDVHSLEEAAFVIGKILMKIRDSDLPKAISLAKSQYSYIKEGLSLNPAFPTLRLYEIQFLRFAGEGDKFLETYKDLSNDNQISKIYRQLAFCELIEYLDEHREFKIALDMINEVFSSLDSQISDKIEYIKYKIYAEHYMIGKCDDSGNRLVINEVIDFFIKKINGKYEYPVIVGRIFNWMTKTDEAIGALVSVADQNWEAQKELAMLYSMHNDETAAIDWANKLVETAPWRAESYDVLAFVSKSDEKLSGSAKAKADDVFKKQLALYDELRAIIS